MSEDYVLEALLEFSRESKERALTEAYVLNCILQGLRSLFGETGAAFPVRLETFSRTPAGGARFILRCPAHCYIKVRSSLTLQSTYQSELCAFHVVKAGRTLLELNQQ